MAFTVPEQKRERGAAASHQQRDDEAARKRKSRRDNPQQEHAARQKRREAVLAAADLGDEQANAMLDAGCRPVPALFVLASVANASWKQRWPQARSVPSGT